MSLARAEILALYALALAGLIRIVQGLNAFLTPGVFNQTSSIYLVVLIAYAIAALLLLRDDAGFAALYAMVGSYYAVGPLLLAGTPHSLEISGFTAAILWGIYRSTPERLAPRSAGDTVSYLFLGVSLTVAILHLLRGDLAILYLISLLLAVLALGFVASRIGPADGRLFPLVLGFAPTALDVVMEILGLPALAPAWFLRVFLLAGPLGIGYVYRQHYRQEQQDHGSNTLDHPR